VWQKYLILAILWSFVISCDPSCGIACGRLRFSRWPHKRSCVVNFYVVIFKFTDHIHRRKCAFAHIRLFCAFNNQFYFNFDQSCTRDYLRRSLLYEVIHYTYNHATPIITFPTPSFPFLLFLLFLPLFLPSSLLLFHCTLFRLSTLCLIFFISSPFPFLSLVSQSLVPFFFLSQSSLFLSVCVSRVSLAKTTKSIEMPFEMWMRGGYATI